MMLSQCQAVLYYTLVDFYKGNSWC